MNDKKPHQEQTRILPTSSLFLRCAVVKSICKALMSHQDAKRVESVRQRYMASGIITSEEFDRLLTNLLSVLREGNQSDVVGIQSDDPSHA